MNVAHARYVIAGVMVRPRATGPGWSGAVPGVSMGARMTPTTIARQQEIEALEYCQWLGRFAIMSEKVDGRWRHVPFTDGPFWQAHMICVETRTTAM